MVIRRVEGQRMLVSDHPLEERITAIARPFPRWEAAMACLVVNVHKEQHVLLLAHRIGGRMEQSVC